MVQGLLVFMTILKNHVAVHEQLGIFIGIVDAFLARLKGVNDFKGHFGLLVQVVGDSEAQPVHFVVWLDLEQLVADIDVLLEISHLDQEQRVVADDVEVVLVVLEGVVVALYGLFIVFLGAMKQAIDVPANVRGQVQTEALLDKCVCLCGSAEGNG